MTGLGGGNTASHAAPGHHRGVGRQAAFQNLVPTDHAPVLGCHEFLDPFDKVTLQLFAAFEILGLHLRPTQRATQPSPLRAFVTTDMDVRPREQVRNLPQHFLQEFIGLLVANAELPWPLRFTAVFSPGQRAIQFRICQQRRRFVTWHVDFRHNGDVSLRGIPHHLPDFVLRIKTGLDAGRVRRGIQQLGTAFDFDAPCAEVGQVPMEHIELMHRHQINKSFHKQLALEIVAGIEHQPRQENRG